MDDLHQTRHQLRNKGASKILNRTNNSRSTEAEASTEIHQRNAALQVLHQTNGQNIGHHSRCRCLRRQRLGRMCNNAEVNFGLCHQVHGRSDSLRQPHAINNSTQQRRSRTLRHQHRSNRSTPHSKLSDRSTQQEESQHQNPHGLIKWQKHSNKNWIIKESKAH